MDKKLEVGDEVILQNFAGSYATFNGRRGIVLKKISSHSVLVHVYSGTPFTMFNGKKLFLGEDRHNGKIGFPMPNNYFSFLRKTDNG